MRVIILISVLLTLSTISYSQASDFITVKKRNNRIIKTYFPGSFISCQTVYGYYVAGTVHAVRNDSVLIQQFEVRSVPNMWGVSSVDTVGSYLVSIVYKDIEKVVTGKRESFGFVKNGTILMIGGLGYAALNLVNGSYLNQSITSPENMKSLAIAFGVAGTGLLINRLRKYNNRNGKRYRIEYVHMNNPLKVKAF